MPNGIILFLFLLPNNILIKKINIHIAHGLKPSTNPIIAAISGKETFLESTSPSNGTETVSLSIFSLSVSFVSSPSISLIFILVPLFSTSLTKSI